MKLNPKIDGNQVITLNMLLTLKMKDDDEIIIEFINTWKRKLDDCLTTKVDINQKLQRLLLLGALPNTLGMLLNFLIEDLADRFIQI